VAWEEAADWQKQSALDGVNGTLQGSITSAEEAHEAWAETKEADGWVYGKVKDPVLKTHPSLVPYSELSVTEREKDFLFRAVVNALR
jgi:hypothetical protein